MAFTFLVFAHMPGKSCRRQLGSLLLCLWDVFGVLINTFVVAAFYFLLFVFIYIAYLIQIVMNF